MINFDTSNQILQQVYGSWINHKPAAIGEFIQQTAQIQPEFVVLLYYVNTATEANLWFSVLQNPGIFDQ